MNGVPMKFDFTKTLNDQLDTFNYYKNRYISYELQISNLIQENNEIKEKLSMRENMIYSINKKDKTEVPTELRKKSDVDLIKQLQQENADLKRKGFMYLNNRVIELEQKIDKAIEYIKVNSLQNGNGVFIDGDYNELLEILKGNR